MVVSIAGAIIGALIAAFGLYCLVKEWKDTESKKIYGIISGSLRREFPKSLLATWLLRMKKPPSGKSD